MSSIEFQETGDRSHVIGRHVSYSAAMSNTGGLYSGGYGGGNSRENTLAKARVKIKAVADSVGNLVSTDIDVVGMAHQYYKLALGKNFLSGRKSEHVAVACLYLVCRKSKTDHLLIDFSDSTQTNVYNLGRVFIQLIQLLQEHKLPIIDPSLFIHRYVKRLQLEEKQVKPITMTALRLVTRMKKDWIATGRRPDGVCAAALLIATRAHGIHRSQTDIAKLFRITSDTLRRRLQEFRESPAAQLSLEDFTVVSEKQFEELTGSLEEMDPPAFTRGLRTSQESASDDEHIPGRAPSARRRAFAELYEDIYSELSKIEEEEVTRRRPRRLEVSDADVDTLQVDDEVEECLLNDDERSVRHNVWESEYRAVLDAREAQRRVREAEEMAKSTRLTKSGKKRKVNERRDLPRESARKAVEDVLTQTSRKINYEAFGESFREDGSFKTPEEVSKATIISSPSKVNINDDSGVLKSIVDDEGAEDDDAIVAEDDVEDEDYDFDYYD